MTHSRRWLRLLAIVAVTVVGLSFRLRAVDRLPIDFDEDDYLLAAQRYAQDLRDGNWADIVNWDYNYEHPPLTKLAYGAAVLPWPPSEPISQVSSSAPPARSLPQPHFTISRLLSATFGTLAVLALALLDPLAAFFLAIHTWQIKYTSQIMLEPLPALTSTLMVLCYAQSRRVGGSMFREGGPRPALRNAQIFWLILSAIALGLTAASKYTYCIAGIAIVVDWLWATLTPRPPLPTGKVPSGEGEPKARGRAIVRWLAPVLAWGLLAIVVFVIADPRLWNDPVGRLVQSVAYHADYAQSLHVKQAGYPTWQPLVWLSGPVPWHPGVFVLPLDLFVSLLAVAGLRRMWRSSSQRVLVIWLFMALGFLLWWNTKWPQYILTLTVPLTVAAAHGFAERVWEPFLGWWQRVQVTGLRWTMTRQPDTRRAFAWLLPGLIALSLFTIFPLVYQGAMALTDFNAISIKDGIQGGIWRETWKGLTGQVAPARVDLFSTQPSKEVHYVGPSLLTQLFTGLGADILFFNVMWTALSVILQTTLGVGAALMLNRRGVWLTGWWRTIFIVPWAIPEFVGAVIWLRMFVPRYGWFNQALPAEIRAPPLDNINYAVGVLLLSALWYGFPFILLAATAAFKLFPPEVDDAAAIDGAAGWARFRHVTWPLLWPLLAPAIIIRAIFAFNQFYLFFVMDPPFPLLTFATLSYYLFNPSYGGLFAVSAAINIFTVVVLVGLILWFNRVSKAGEGVAYA